jgi:hypothetical protein
MQDNLDQCVFSIHNDQKDIVGTGFFVANKVGVTCAHVIQKACTAAGRCVNIHCFMHDKDRFYQPVVSPDGWSAVEKDDIAFLEFSEQPPGTTWLALTAAQDSLGHNYRSLGYPQSDFVIERRADDLISGLVNRRGGGQYLQMEGDEVDRGMSGAPVFDTELGKVVGMISLGQANSFTKLVYATPAETLQQHFPKLTLEFPILTLEDRRSYRVITKRFSEALLRDPEELDCLLVEYEQLVRQLQEWKELHNFMDLTLQLYDAFSREIKRANRNQPTLSDIRNSWGAISDWLGNLNLWARNEINVIAEKLIVDGTGKIIQGPDWAIQIEERRADISKYLEDGKKCEEEFRKAPLFKKITTKNALDEFWFSEMEELSEKLKNLVMINMHIADGNLRETAGVLYEKAQRLYRVEG